MRDDEGSPYRKGVEGNSKFITACVLMLGIGAILSGFVGRDATRPPDGPELRVNGEVFRQLGALNHGQEVAELFQVTNVGQEPLHINSIWTSCGCTIATLGFSEIQAGATVEITCYPDSNVYGQKRSRIFVDIDGFQEPFEIGAIAFEVRTGWKSHFDPYRLDVEAPENEVQPPFTLTADEDISMESIWVELEWPGLSASVHAVGRFAQVDFSWDSSKLPIGSYLVSGVLHSNSINNPDFPFFVEIDNQSSRLSLKPALLSAGFVTCGEHFEVSAVFVVDNEPVIALSIESLSQELEISDLRSSTGDGATFSAVFQGDYAGSFEGLLLVTSDAKTFVVSIIASVKESE